MLSFQRIEGPQDMEQLVNEIVKKCRFLLRFKGIGNDAEKDHIKNFKLPMLKKAGVNLQTLG